MPVLTLGELQARLGVQLQGDPAAEVEAVASLVSAGPRRLSFVVSPRYADQARASQAGALVIPPALTGEFSRPCLIAANPQATFARAASLLHDDLSHPVGIHSGAVVHPDAVIGENAYIGPGAVVEAGARIGPGCRIGAHCFIGANVTIGASCTLHPHVTVQRGCRLGDRCILHPGCVIGADGFGNAWDTDHWVKIPQVGKVELGSDVEVGANTTIDRGALDDTVIEDGVRLDNLIQIAHNCRIGRNTAIAACTGIAGSTRIGANCLIGGAAMIIGHLEICDAVQISAGTFVAKDIRTPGAYTSTQPLMAHADWKRNAAHLRHLDALVARVKALEKQLKKDAS
ncbi:MAG: UDP-3-O-(3-hydroxymyristoyl)glucosamine N-acyltransferase [Betaproteobacteria bacterium]|nr:UDP-3-O-(3-hydroxymyristoyl)glucosamine N-acyltransferase [Betaproteobacteria bacterium]